MERGHRPRPIWISKFLASANQIPFQRRRKAHHFYQALSERREQTSHGRRSERLRGGRKALLASACMHVIIIWFLKYSMPFLFFALYGIACTKSLKALLHFFLLRLPAAPCSAYTGVGKIHCNKFFIMLLRLCNLWKKQKIAKSNAWIMFCITS